MLNPLRVTGAPVLCTAMLLGGCAAGLPVPGGDQAAAAVRYDGRAIQAAVGHTARPSLDRQRDEQRNPQAVLEFFEIVTGEIVLDMFAGGGYYTEILARAVGPDGVVYAHNNGGYRQFLGDKDAPRYANDRLPNVIRLEAEIDEIELADASIDTIWMVLSYHDVYFKPQAADAWQPIDGVAMLANFYRMLKPGGVLAIVDHAGRSGMSLEEINQLHRIDRRRLVREIRAAGFTLEQESDILRNPDDDYTMSVFDPDVRGRTDRLVLRFRKSAG